MNDLKLLLDLADWLSRHPRFRSLRQTVLGSGQVQLAGYPLRLFVWITEDCVWWWDLPYPSTACQLPEPPPADLLAAATDALTLRARQLARRYPVC